MVKIGFMNEAAAVTKIPGAKMFDREAQDHYKEFKNWRSNEMKIVKEHIMRKTGKKESDFMRRAANL
eukprot:CAMPEP_0116873362 /NCGR_PEP_ID=MMETSP0463-20121206/4416_1 /TAXON_ID=181622 /ORGANISM="Strombidinopsis sp, Strain SopsisLIS2011" /LENGTH=66 /DNA_ID=CAMNT_0004515115 /DNA_START=1198 /DNA_END=1398 /DNA_ORIENTATION=+